jgi:hypothetical protein
MKNVNLPKIDEIQELKDATIEYWLVACQQVKFEDPKSVIMEKSISWKITKPLRLLNKYSRQIFAKLRAYLRAG